MTYYNMIGEARELAEWSAEKEALSVYHALEKVADPRRRQGKRYALALVLTYVLLAKMAGETTLQAITEWVRLRGDWLQKVLPESRTAFPCAATYSKVLGRIDPEQINQVLMDLLMRVRAAKRKRGEQEHVILDGKVLRGTQGHLAEDQQKMHHINLYEAKTGIILKQRMVADKAGELTHLEEFLTPTLLKGRIISADALYTQKRFCQATVTSGGDDVLFVKGNQPTLSDDVRQFFRDPPLDCLDWRTDGMADKGYGRQSQRFIQVSTQLNDFLARDWYEVGQVFCLRRRVQYPLKCTQEYVYGITSLTPKRANTFRLLELIREHWAIENRLHYRCDVSLTENACQVRKGTAPHALAVLNSFVLALFDGCGITNVKQAMRRLEAQPLLAAQLLLTSLAQK